MPKPQTVWIGLDQGSSSTKSLILNQQGEVLAGFSTAVSTQFLSDIQVEQDPLELRNSVTEVLEQALAYAHSRGFQIEGIGLSCQRSGVLAWRGTSKVPVHGMISWRDTRTSDFLESLDSAQEILWTKSGLPLSAHYAAGKVALLQTQFSDSDIRIGTLDSYLVDSIFNSDQTPCFHTEDSMAHRTMLYSIEAKAWDLELCSLFRVQRDRLAQIWPSMTTHGSYSGIPLQFMCGDQQAGLLVFRSSKNAALLGLGTSALLAVQTGSLRTDLRGYIPSILYSADREGQRHFEYLIEGTVNYCARTFDYLDKLSRLCRQEFFDLYLKAISSDQAIAFCSFGSTTSPDWKREPPDLLLEWKEGGTALELAFSLFENLVFSIGMHLKYFKEQGLLSPVRPLPAAGGFSNYSIFLQALADVSDISIFRYDNEQLCAYGAALGARGLGNGQLVCDFDRQIFKPESGALKLRFSKWLNLREQVVNGNLPSESVGLNDLLVDFFAPQAQF